MFARFALVVVTSLTLLLTGILAGCGGDNVEACRDYVESRNQAYVDCGMEDQLLDPDVTCPTTLDTSGIDCSAYYEALAGSYQCTGGEVTWEDEASCT